MVSKNNQINVLDLSKSKLNDIGMKNMLIIIKNTTVESQTILNVLSGDITVILFTRQHNKCWIKSKIPYIFFKINRYFYLKEAFFDYFAILNSKKSLALSSMY